MKNNKRIGLSLSGGGYRATIYHLGTLKKLKELGLLDKIDVISTISGGSITGAFYSLNQSDFTDFENKLKKVVKKNIIDTILFSPRMLLVYFILLAIVYLAFRLLYTPYPWMSSLVLIGVIYFILKFQYFIFPSSKMISDLYSKWFFDNKTLDELSEKPILAINATNIETCRLFTFSKKRMSDSSYGSKANPDGGIAFSQKKFPISLAVASSTCVPFAFSPIYIDKNYFEDPKDYDVIKPCLVDGGVYDNQGLHKLTQDNSYYSCDIIIVSDAGNKLASQTHFSNVIQLLTRTSDIFMDRIKKVQMIQHVYENYQTNKRQIAYQSLGWDVDNCFSGFMTNLKKGIVTESVIQDHAIPQTDIDNGEWDKIEHYLKIKINYMQILSQSPSPEELALARSVVTNLKPLPDDEINALIKQAYCMTELQTKLYCPFLFLDT